MLISLIVPVFNEVEVIPLFYKEVRRCINLENYELEIIFINDGSNDGTEELLDALSIEDTSIVVIHFARNFGKEAALMAGLKECHGDVSIPLDVDLQDPIYLIPDMLKIWEDGAEIVLAKRIDRSHDHYLKRMTAALFYSVHNKISYPRIEENVGDFRLLSKNIVNRIIELKEKNLFMKGILAWVGGETRIIEYVRHERVAGKTKFNAWKLWNLALEGITSFSTLPLRVWTYIGLLIALSSFAYGTWIILSTMLWGNSVKGYPSLLVIILFLGGVQLIGIGVLGEYLGRIYLEVKNRPRYIVKNKKKDIP